MMVALGTVQFGLRYGVANSVGRVSEDAAKDILHLASELGVDTLDTAAAYGNSEQVLGRIGVNRFSIISKIPPRVDNIESPSERVKRCVDQSLKNLQSDYLCGLLLHRPLELLEADGFELYDSLLNIKNQGLARKVGVSIYGPDDLEKLEAFDFDLIQAPMNILDRRLENSGWLDRLNKQGPEVHIRSAFLQGLLLMNEAERPEYFKPWRGLLRKYDAWVASQELTPLQACLGYLYNHSAISKVVVGVDTPVQLREIVEAANIPIPSPPESLQTDDQSLINPALWKL